MDKGISPKCNPSGNGIFIRPSPDQGSQSELYLMLDDKAIQCRICVHECVIRDGEKGFCKARMNRGGRIYIPPEFPISERAVVPYHRLKTGPEQEAANILVIGGWGCNLYCSHCINVCWSYPDIPVTAEFFTPDEILGQAQAFQCRGIAFSITEPIVHIEHLYRLIRGAKMAGMSTIICTNGVFTRRALRIIWEWVDVFRIDLKGFSDEAYKRVTGVEAFEVVIGNIKALWDAGKEVILQYVPIPGINDNSEEIKEGTSRMLALGLCCLPINVLRFIPSGKLSHMEPATDRYLFAVASWFDEAGFSTLLMQV